MRTACLYNNVRKGARGLFVLCAGMRGGRFNSACPKSEVEWACYNARGLPGPGAYEAPALSLGGGRFGTSSAPGHTELEMARAAAIPGPAHYAPLDRGAVAHCGSHNAGHALQLARVRRQLKA